MKDSTSISVYVEPILSNGASLQMKVPVGTYLVTWTDAKTGAELSSKQQRFGSITTLPLPTGSGEKVVRLKRLR
jgi:hypothetical protein